MSKWIRVSEKLPTPNEDVLVTYQDGDERAVTTASYSVGGWTDLESCERGYDGCERGEVQNVLAWMPKPEPFDEA